MLVSLVSTVSRLVASNAHLDELVVDAHPGNDPFYAVIGRELSV